MEEMETIRVKLSVEVVVEIPADKLEDNDNILEYAIDEIKNSDNIELSEWEYY